MYRSAVVANAGIEIPPNTPRHEETAYITFPEKATLYSIFPHAHYRAENMADLAAASRRDEGRADPRSAEIRLQLAARL